MSEVREQQSRIMFWGRLAVILHLISWLENGNADPATSCWTSGNWSCTDPEPYLLVGLRNVILRMDLDGGGQKQLVSGVGNDVLMDFHYREGRVYWVDTHKGVLSRVDWDGKHTQKLLFLGKGISGLAVDWRENRVYWSSRKTGTIQQADTDGHNIKTVLRDLTQPSSVVIDPNAGFVFWLSAGVVSSIQRSDRSGGLIITLMRTSDRLLSLAADVVKMKLFWIQHGVKELDSLGSCDYNGNLVNVITQRLGTTSPKMWLFSGYVFVTDSASPSVLRVNMHTGEPPDKVSIKSFTMPSVPVDGKVIGSTNQPAAGSRTAFTRVCETDGCVNVCFSSSGGCKCKPGFRLSKNGDYCEDVNECALWNHGCSLGCENVPGSYFCTCPERYVLLSDHRTCREMKPCVENGTLCEHACTHTLEGDVCVCPVGSSLEPDGRSCTGCVSVDRGGCSQVCVTLLPGRWECACQPGYQLQPDGKQCKASGPSALLLFANMMDVRSVNMDGSESRSLINGSKHAIMFVDHDPVQNKVYFVDTERSRIERVSVNGGETEMLITDLVSPQGIAVDWINRKLYWTDRGMSSVSRSSLNGLERELLIQDKLLQPRDVAVHPEAQMILWTDVGIPVAVWRAGLDGDERSVLIGSGLVSPCGIVVDHSTHTLYWSDIGTGHIESARLDGSQRHTHEQVGRPFDVAVFEDTLWFSNWEDNHIYRLDKRTGSDAERLSVDSVQPASLVIVHPLVKPGADLCLHGNGGCSQLCESRLGLVHCFCHSKHILSDDGKTCFPVDSLTSSSSLSSSSSSSGSGDGEWSDQVRKKSLNNESSPLSQSSERAPFTEKMVSVERSGASRPSSETPPTVTAPWRRGDVVEICPSSHDSYCLHNAVCFYFPEIETYACNCAPGYMGERCQYTDLEWWDLQQAEQERRRNTAIAVCISLLLLMLTITATITYCYRSRRYTGRRAAVEVVSETSVCEESIIDMPSVGPQFYVLLDHRVCNHEKIFHLVDSQRKEVCPCCSSETGESVVSEDSRTQKTVMDLVDGDTPETSVKLCVNLISLEDLHTPSLI